MLDSSESAVSVNEMINCIYYVVLIILAVLTRQSILESTLASCSGATLKIALTNPRTSVHLKVFCYEYTCAILSLCTFSSFKYFVSHVFDQRTGGSTHPKDFLAPFLRALMCPRIKAIAIVSFLL